MCDVKSKGYFEQRKGSPQLLTCAFGRSALHAKKLRIIVILS